jgi:enoyl-CoA hydratase/carnithine racemase
LHLTAAGMIANAPLADVLVLAAHAWERFRTGQSLDRAIAQAVGTRTQLRPAVQDVTYTAVRHLAFSEHVIAALATLTLAGGCGFTLCIGTGLAAFDATLAVSIIALNNDPL